MSKRPGQENPRNILYLLRLIRAPREEVFRAWTDPKELRRWFSPEELGEIPVAEMDLKKGGGWRIGMKSPETDLHYVSGQVRDFKAPVWMIFTWNWDGDVMWSREPSKVRLPETVVTIQLAERLDGAATELLLSHQGLDAVGREDHRWGWARTLDRLQYTVG